MNILSFALSPPPPQKKNGQAPLTSTIPPPPTIKHKSTQSANYNGNDIRIYMKSYIRHRPSKFAFMVVYVMVQFYPWFKFYFSLFKLTIVDYHTPKQRKIKFKPRIKFNHNIYKDKIMNKCNHAPKTVLRIKKIMNFGATWA